MEYELSFTYSAEFWVTIPSELIFMFIPIYLAAKTMETTLALKSRIVGTIALSMSFTKILDSINFSNTLGNYMLLLISYYYHGNATVN